MAGTSPAMTAESPMRDRPVKYTAGEIGRLRVIKDFLACRNDLRVSDEQLAEVRRRRADPARKLVSHEQARERIKRL